MVKTEQDYEGLIDRYVYDVTRRLPSAQREDIDRELRGLIEDMLAQRSADPTQYDVEEVLKELGRPSELAAKYRGTTRYLIGPELFDTYFLVLKIVMGAVALGIAISLIVGMFANLEQNIFAAIGTFFATVISEVIQAFAWVTVVFALIERFALKSGKWKMDAWEPADLPEIPQDKTRINPGGPIVGIVFAIIGLFIFNAVPHVLSIYVLGDPMVKIPVFDLDVLRSMILLVDIIICLSILKEAFRLISGRYTLRLAAVAAVINIAAVVLMITVFLPPTIWNGDLVAELGASADMSWATELELARIWAAVPAVVVAIAVFGYVVDTINNIVRVIRGAVR